MAALYVVSVSVSVHGTLTTNWPLELFCIPYVLPAVEVTALADTLCTVSLFSFDNPRSSEVAALRVACLELICVCMVSLVLISLNCCNWLLEISVEPANNEADNFIFPFTSNFWLGLVVPIPTLPLTIIPLLGAAWEPAYEPILILPSTSKTDFGSSVLIPNVPGIYTLPVLPNTTWFDFVILALAPNAVEYS